MGISTSDLVPTHAPDRDLHAPGSVVMRYITRVAIAIDTCINACLPNGRLDETMSTRAMIEQGRWPWSWLYRALDACFPKHCEHALRHDQQRSARFNRYATTKEHENGTT